MIAPPPDVPVADERQARRAALLAAARDGSQESLAELIADLTPLLWQVARSQGVDREQSADIVQSTWVQLLERLHEIHTPTALVGWLVTVTKRDAWRTKRSASTTGPTDEDLTLNQPDPGPSPEQRVLEAERGTELWAALARLPEVCQQLLRIVAFVESPCYAEISERLDMKRGSIGPTRGRCLAQLRVLLTVDNIGGGR